MDWFAGGSLLKKAEGESCPVSRWYMYKKAAQRLTARLRIAPPVGRCLGLGPSLAPSRRLQKAEAQPPVPARGLSRRPTCNLVTPLAEKQRRKRRARVTGS